MPETILGLPVTGSYQGIPIVSEVASSSQAEFAVMELVHTAPDDTREWKVIGLVPVPRTIRHYSEHAELVQYMFDMLDLRGVKAPKSYDAEDYSVWMYDPDDE